MRKHEEESFRVFARRQTPVMRRSAYLLCGDWHAADDLVQMALLKLFKAWPRIERQRTPTNYARKALLNCWLDEKRRPWRRHEQTEGEMPDVEHAGTDPSLAHERLHTHDELVAVLAEVPPRQRAVLVLRYFQQLSITETAAALGCSEGTVKSQANRGLTALRDAYQRRKDLAPREESA